MFVIYLTSLLNLLFFFHFLISNYKSLKLFAIIIILIFYINSVKRSWPSGVRLHPCSNTSGLRKFLGFNASTVTVLALILEAWGPQNPVTSLPYLTSLPKWGCLTCSVELTTSLASGAKSIHHYTLLNTSHGLTKY